MIPKKSWNERESQQQLGSKPAFVITTEAKHRVRPTKPGFTA